VLRRGVRGIERHPGEPGERRGGDDRATVRHQPLGQFPRTEDDAVEVGADDSPVLALGELGSVRVADSNPGVEERRVELTCHAIPRVRVRYVEVRQVEHDRVVEQRADRTSDSAAAAGH
jgi:hypothetical protein